MGRLFWKFLFAFWVTLLLAAAGVATFVTLHERAAREQQAPLTGGPRASFVVDTAAATLKFGGLEALESFLAENKQRGGLPIAVVDDGGRELTGRPVSDEVIAAARQNARLVQAPNLARSVRLPDGRDLLLFIPAGAVDAARAPPPSPAIPIVAGVLAGLLFSVLLAWYVVSPIRQLRWAFNAAAQGRLDTRVMPRMNARRDEIADLGRDFDRMVQQLEVLVSSQQRLLNDVSHELRSPLARLQAAIGLARQNPAKTEAMLERIEHESSRLDALVGEILTLVRLEGGPDRAGIARIDFTDLVATIVDDARFEGHPANRNVRFVPEGHAIVEGHFESLYRAVENVIRNAVKYTVEGTAVDVRLTVKHAGAGETRAVLTVADRGPGVPAEELEAIFKPFYRASNSQRWDGFGLGLAIASRAVAMHGGSIRAQQRDGGGLCFEIVLPAQRGGNESPATYAPGSGGHGGS